MPVAARRAQQARACKRHHRQGSLTHTTSHPTISAVLLLQLKGLELLHSGGGRTNSRISLKHTTRNKKTMNDAGVRLEAARERVAWSAGILHCPDARHGKPHPPTKAGRNQDAQEAARGAEDECELDMGRLNQHRTMVAQD